MSIVHESLIKNSVRVNENEEVEVLKPGVAEFALRVINLKAWYGKVMALNDVNMLHSVTGDYCSYRSFRLWKVNLYPLF